MKLLGDRKTKPIKWSVKLKLQDKHCQPTSTVLVRQSSKYEAQLSKEIEDQTEMTHISGTLSLILDEAFHIKLSS